MASRNVLIAAIVAGLVSVGEIFALGALDKEFNLTFAVVLTVVIVSGLLLVSLGSLLALWPSGEDWEANRPAQFREVAVGAFVAVGVILLLTWALVWIGDRYPNLSKSIFPVVLVAVGIVLVAAAFGALGKVLQRSRTMPPLPRVAGVFSFGPKTAFWVAIGYLAGLLGLAVLFTSSPTIQRHLQNGILGHVLPVGVPWYGALGAVTISLYGVFRHNDEWQTKYDPWHLARPLVGAVLGMIAYFIFVAVISSTTSGQTGSFDVEKTKPEGFIVYYVVAFIVGYREETFRDLIKRATDMLFRPGGLAAEGIIDLLPPSPILFDPPATGETTSIRDVQLRNGSDVSLVVPDKGVTFVGGDFADWEVIPQPDQGKLTWWEEGKPTPVAPGDSVWFHVQWTPTTSEAERTNMLVSYVGFDGPPKTAVLVGRPPAPGPPPAPPATPIPTDPPEPPA